MEETHPENRRDAMEEMEWTYIQYVHVRDTLW